MVTRFFSPDRFPSVDAAWVSQNLQLAQGDIQLSEYTNSRTLYRHRTLILTQLGYAAFEPAHRLESDQEARRLTHLQTRPALIMDALVSYLRERRVETPPYDTLREITIEALDDFDVHLQTLIEQHLDPDDRAMIDALLDNTATSERAGRYPLTDLKRISQSMRLKNIAERVALFSLSKMLSITFL